MRSKKNLCCGMLMFNLPDDFNGSKADALRLVADYMDETEGKQKNAGNILGTQTYDELIDMITHNLFDNKDTKLNTIGLHIGEFEDYIEIGGY